MTRRLTLFATGLLVLFALLVAQAINVQWERAPGLSSSPLNPRLSTVLSQFPRGEIVAADGTILARSVASNNAAYPYVRQYPLGNLVSGVVGFAGPSYGTWALEYQYNTYLEPHAQPPQSLAQVLAPTSAADTLTLTLEPALQRVASVAMAGQVGAAVTLDPRTGAVLGMYSNPNYDPTPFTSSDLSVAQAAWKAATTADKFGFEPLGNLATQQTFPPGSTFKVITTAAAVVHKPALLKKFYKREAFTPLPDTNKLLYNDGGTVCGGTVAMMLPPSCDPGYGLLGLDVGAQNLSETAYSFGYNSTPPLDLPGGEVNQSYFPPAASFARSLPTLAYSAIGQDNVRATALQQALLAAAIANGGVAMTPHLMASITSPTGTLITKYQTSVWKTPLTKSQAATIVPLMVNVVRFGTAAGIFPWGDNVAAKTGTAQAFLGTTKYTDDWMIAFAPATNPTVAVAVAMPFQSDFHFGATTAGPIVKCLIEGALAIQHGQPATGTSSTCPR
jgi:peptidoglycan glycosyltransferase